MQYLLIIPIILLILSFLLTEDVLMGIFMKKLTVGSSA